MPDASISSTSNLVDLTDRRLGRYRIRRALASGGMASVHLATADGRDGFEKIVALKVIHEHLASDPSFVEMFLDEARIAARIDHTNVCSVFDFGAADDTYYIAMEYLVGEPLATIRDAVRRRPYSTEWPMIAASLVAQAAEGLHAAHNLTDETGRSVGLVHRDVSPQNLFVTYGGTVKVVDFGIARAAGRSHHTAPGTIKGKFAYLAPEQLTDAESVDRRADVWALGVTLWELLVMKPLFRRSNAAETLTAVMTRSIVPPSSVQPLVPRELDAIVMKALSRDRETRYATAREFGRDLAEACRSRRGLVGPLEIEEWLATLFPGGEDERRSVTHFARELTYTRPKTVPPPEPKTLSAIDPAGPLATMLRTAPEARPRPVGLFVASGVAMVASGVALAFALASRGAIPTTGSGRVGAAEIANEATTPRADEDRSRSGEAADGPADDESRGIARSRSTSEASDMAARTSSRLARSPDRRALATRTPGPTTEAAAPVVAAPLPAPAETVVAPPQVTAPPPVIEAPSPPARIEAVRVDSPLAARPSAPSFEATIAIRGLGVQGALPTTTVRSAIERVASRMRQCYAEDARRAGRDAPAEVGVRFAIDETGAVRNVSADGPPGLASCVRAAVSRLRTRDRPDIGFVQVAFTARFVPTGGH